MAGARSDVNAQNAIRREARGAGLPVFDGGLDFGGIISGGIVVTPWSFLACSAAFAMTSATSFPSTTALHPGIKSAHLMIFAMACLLLKTPLPRARFLGVRGL
jgi:hypothetical protein